jgi:glyoxylase-like metal-dependent hydrolase (beta-lactamase superfamily II)
VRASGVHQDVIVVESRAWRTTATAVRDGDEAFLIDSPVFPDELELLPSLLEQARFPVRGLLATHGDWDHLLGRLAFPGGALGVAESTAARLRAQPGAAQRDLRDFDERHYLARPAPLALGALDALPVPGHCGLGDRELDLHPADGHTADGMVVWIGWAGVLVCGDYLSPVEIPTPQAGVDAYLATLARLEPLVAAAAHVVPGHGGPIDAPTALALLGEDRAYLEVLRAEPAAAPLPPRRRDAEQRRLHAENVARLTRGGP